MSGDPLRVAFFPDAYHEIDGVANTSRQYEAFAQRRGLPFLTVYGGHKERTEIEGSLTRMECARSAVGFALDKKHTFDLAFWRHYERVETAVRDFAPDIVHITGPSDVGMLGALVSHRLQVPLAASWHTNLHQYAEQRGSALLSWLPGKLRKRLGFAMREGTLRALFRFYKIAQILFAPNQELIDLLEGGTGKACYLMPRGVDTDLFSPQRRDRTDSNFVIGYVGRLTVEKNIHWLAEIERTLRSATAGEFRFLIVGQGAEEPWLKAHMKNAEFTGVLQGEALARAYANMDVFVFPSQTDTFGNVVLEAMASSVPVIVTDRGGPRFIVRPGETGFLARDVQEFCRWILHLDSQPDLVQRMRNSVRGYANSASWDCVFEGLYAAYERGLRTHNPSWNGKKIRIRTGSEVCV
jgi:phosphatidylinositol alpha 1,6-mannosyltransferase